MAEDLSRLTARERELVIKTEREERERKAKQAEWDQAQAKIKEANAKAEAEIDEIHRRLEANLNRVKAAAEGVHKALEQIETAHTHDTAELATVSQEKRLAEQKQAQEAEQKRLQEAQKKKAA